jgi:acetylornithine deacetylase/succinyl-diaminopimelate desuccinylase family protein
MEKSEIFSLLDKEIETNKEEQIDFLRKLIQTKSANPFTPDKSVPETPVERAIAEIIHEKLIDMNITSKLIGVSPFRPNVLAEINGGEKTLILNGHMDTVLPGDNWTQDPYGASISGNRLYGLGAVDMKASLSVFIYAAKAITDIGLKLDGKLVLTFVVDEEPGACSNYGTKYLIKNGLHGDAAIVGEPGNRNIAIGHRGGYRFKITVLGEAVHSGFKSWEDGTKGHNAIIDMAKVIDALIGFEIRSNKTEAFQNRKSVFTFPTVIEGGTSINVVPEKCVAYGDCRLLPGVTAQTIKENIEESLNRIANLDYYVDDLLYVPAVEISSEEEIVRILRNAMKSTDKKPPSTVVSGPWNDGWMFITNGIPAVCGFGPSGSSAHSPDEYVLIDDVISTTKIYTRAIIDYLGVK